MKAKTLILGLSVLASSYSYAHTPTQTLPAPILDVTQLLNNPQTKKFYDTLSEQERTDFASLIDRLNTIFNETIVKVSSLEEPYRDLIAKFKSAHQLGAIRLNISISADTPAADTTSETLQDNSQQS